MIRGNRLRFLLLIAGAFVNLSALARGGRLADLPDGFAQQIVAEGITGATGMVIANDGRIFIAEQTGTLRLIKDGVLLQEPVLKLEVDSTWERGLIGLTLDPQFPKAPFLYACYVAPQPYPHHRVSRFTYDGDHVRRDSELVLLSGDDQTKLGGAVPAGHQGGGIHFGADGKLYVAIGEQTAGEPSQHLDTFQGKILRINPDGSIPDDNPFAKKAQGKYRAIWAYGLRNPFGFAVQPGTGRLFINDVGESRWEEINEGIAGANYGWPHVEGPTLEPRYRSPIHAYSASSMKSVSGGVFYSPAHPSFPNHYVGKYFFADFNLNWIRVLDPNHPASVELFASGLAGPVDLQVGPDGSLYCLNRNAWVKDNQFRPNTGSLLRIFHADDAGKTALKVLAHPKDAIVVEGDRAVFQVATQGEGLNRFYWERNGQRIPGAESSTYVIEYASTSDNGRHFQCVVSNSLGALKSRPAALWLVKPRQAPAAPPMLAGLEYETHRVSGSSLPAFTSETHVSSGTTSDISVDLEPRAKAFGLTFRGFLEVDQRGAYTFDLESSGTAKLYVASAEVVTLVPGGGTSRQGSGTIGLKPGRHPIRLDYAQSEGAPLLTLKYSGPGFHNRAIPHEKLFRIDRSISAAPSVEPPGGRYTGPITVTLTTPSTTGHLRFALDGAPLNANSPLYEQPLSLKQTTTVTAGLFLDGSKKASATSQAKFEIVGTEPYGLERVALSSTITVSKTIEAMPRLLSETGLFRSLEDLTPEAGVIPYAVNSPLWSDGANKQRWVVFPGDARAQFSVTGPWKFPEGTVFVKHFELGSSKAARENPSRRRLETRVLVIDRAGQGFGVTYRWRPDQRDAELLNDGLTEEVSWTTSEGKRSQTWTYPSRHDCLTCHTPQAGFVLGVNTRQLNRPFRYPGTSTDSQQIRAWNHAHLFENPLPESTLAALPRLVGLADESASLEERTRSYLDTNCAHCHRPGGARAEFDARYEASSDLRRLTAGSPSATDLGIPGARIVAPGDRARSLLYRRMERRGDAFNMPPLASRNVDADALEVIGRWIDSLAEPHAHTSAAIPPRPHNHP